MRGPEPSPARGPRFVLTRASTPIESAVLLGVGAVLVGVGLATGDAGWDPMLVVLIAYAAGYTLVAAIGGGPRMRTLARVQRFLPAEVVRVRPTVPTGLVRAVQLLAPMAFWAAAGTLVDGGAFGLVLGAAMLHDAAIVRAWEREHDVQLAYEHWPWSYRRHHPFGLPEHVGVRPAGAHPAAVGIAPPPLVHDGASVDAGGPADRG